MKAVTDQPIRYVVKTHSHAENTGAYRKLLPSVQTITSAKSRQHMVDAKMATPSAIVFSDEASLFLGGKEIRLLYTGRAHTDGDAVVYFPAERALYVGDLMSATNSVTNPAVDYRSGGSLQEWPASLDRIMTLDSKAALRKHRDKVEAVRNRVRGMVQENKSKDEVGPVLVVEFRLQTSQHAWFGRHDTDFRAYPHDISEEIWDHLKANPHMVTNAGKSGHEPGERSWMSF